ncbi:helix-turn-helix domain-containing protein [Vagococcus salmoninarum]|uniref:helix-turn-helix domain-containing protein n=1 Tax=Vagococcus salmoninarum TaxID=2739 RepID=UPI003F99F035
MFLAQNLKKHRQEQALSQKEVSKQLGVSRQAVSKWETGHSYPDLDNLILISQLYSVTTDELLGLTLPPPKSLDPSYIVTNELLLLITGLLFVSQPLLALLVIPLLTYQRNKILLAPLYLKVIFLYAFINGLRLFFPAVTIPFIFSPF